MDIGNSSTDNGDQRQRSWNLTAGAVAATTATTPCSMIVTMIATSTAAKLTTIMAGGTTIAIVVCLFSAIAIAILARISAGTATTRR